ncbi:MAG: DUF92 domain-containing protein [Promethearchaeota archaeon]|nr:MAG: DUF92 domain-containing protein [Candidatus Lokiarchaeota archaeon]
MNFDIVTIIIGVIIVGGFGIFSIYTKVVDLSGLIAGLIVGLIIWIFGGWSWFLIILLFHLLAAVMTKFKFKKKEVSGLAQEKGGARGWPNVTANGLVAALFSLSSGIYYLLFSVKLDILFFGFIGAVAAMTADTIATELGLLSKTQPRLITTFKKVIPGTSGGVTILGELAALLGSSIIGLFGWVLAIFNPVFNLISGNLIVSYSIVFGAIAGGLLGCLVDSIIGATVQGLYNCSKCDKITEKKVHGCGTITDQIQGIALIDNNVVNLLGSISGSFFSILIYLLFQILITGG